jgi:hypothetical protein
VGRAPLPYLIALLCGFLAAAAIGCGADRSNLIPASDASSLTAQLDEIRAQIDAGQCAGLSDKVKAFHDAATSLNSSVDKRLRTRLREGANSLQDHAVTDCQTAAAAKTQTETTPTTTETTTTETVPPDTTTTTVPPETTTTTTPPTDTTTTPPDSTTTPPADTTTTPATTPSGNGGTPPGEVQIP